MNLEKNLSRLLSRKDEIEERLASSSLDASELMDLSKELSELRPIAEQAQKLSKLRGELDEAEALFRDPDAEIDMKSLAEEEIFDIRPRIIDGEHQLKLLLLPKDKDDSRNAILEIRAGTGGEEAALFGADLFGMYQKFASQQGWHFDILEISETGIGGYKEAAANISGQEVFAKLKFESGVHRVQRVPYTETGGRIHTSAATVAVLPEAEEVDIEIQDSDLRIDIFRSSGPGGQSVNTTDSAVRITHIPTGIVVSQQDEKSQHKNRAKAMKILRSRLYDTERAKQNAERAASRKGQVGSGDRSERIRTYNFPQGRVTDHRINLTLYKLDKILLGESLNELIDALIAEEQAEKLAEGQS